MVVDLDGAELAEVRHEVRIAGILLNNFAALNVYPYRTMLRSGKCNTPASLVSLARDMGWPADGGRSAADSEPPVERAPAHAGGVFGDFGRVRAALDDAEPMASEWAGEELTRDVTHL